MSHDSLKGLTAIAAGRDHITTAEFARATSKSPQTIRKNFCLQGECFGIRPIKVGNNLLWPVTETARLLSGGPTAGRSLQDVRASANDANVCGGEERRHDR